jgi:hypothetical protein
MGAYWYRLSAQNVASRSRLLSQVYGSGAGVPHLAQIGCPLLAFYGTHDVGGANELDIVRRTAVKSSRIDTHLIDDADHVYTGFEARIADLIATWMTTLQ